MLRLVPCGCGTQYLVRVERAWWMRLFPWRRFYFCTECRSRLFIRKPLLASPAAARSMPQPLAERPRGMRQPPSVSGTLHSEAANARD